MLNVVEKKDFFFTLFNLLIKLLGSQNFDGLTTLSTKLFSLHSFQLKPYSLLYMGLDKIKTVFGVCYLLAVKQKFNFLPSLCS